MKLHEIIIKPQSGFGTPLKGDTLFGHFCWQAQHDPSLLNGGLDRWIAAYEERPFAVFASAWPKLSVGRERFYALKRPDLPMPRLFPGLERDRRKRMTERKEKGNQKWLLVGEDLRIVLRTADYKSETELALMAFNELTEEAKMAMRGRDKRRLMAPFSQPHNTINRQTQTTGGGIFSPYAMPSMYFYPEMELAVFVLIDEEATDVARVIAAMERIGKCGFGRDASTGLGRFDLAEDDEKTLPDAGEADACYTLAPAVPEKGAFHDQYFSPFTRFGRHGDALATSSAPFKNPVIMADEGAVLIPAARSVFEKPYLGRAVCNLSNTDARTVAQGYAPYLPFKLEI